MCFSMIESVVRRSIARILTIVIFFSSFFPCDRRDRTTAFVDGDDQDIPPFDFLLLFRQNGVAMSGFFRAGRSSSSTGFRGAPRGLRNSGRCGSSAG